jgi:thiol-disulfide isomerase/thioredoxin
MTPMRLAALMTGLAVAVSLGCTTPRASGRGPTLLGRTVELTASDLEGREVRIAPPSGTRATVVDFWATWCEPCREQLPFLDRLDAAYRDRGVRVLAVAFDEDRAAVEEFVARTPVRFPVLWDKGGARLADRLEITRLPTTLVLDADGVVRAVHLGYDKAEGEKLEKDVQALIAR